MSRVVPPRFILELTKPGVRALTAGAAGNRLYTTFEENVRDMQSLTADDRQVLLDAADKRSRTASAPPSRLWEPTWII